MQGMNVCIFKIKKYGKYTLHLGRHSYYWLAVRVFRVSRGGIIHVLLVLAVIAIVIRLIQGRNV